MQRAPIRSKHKPFRHARIVETAGNAQPDSCTLENAEGYDVAVVTRVPGMVSDQQWQDIVDALGALGDLVQLHNNDVENHEKEMAQDS